MCIYSFILQLCVSVCGYEHASPLEQELQLVANHNTGSVHQIQDLCKSSTGS